MASTSSMASMASSPPPAPRLLPAAQACSELGYYLACFEAALAYVVDATEGSLGAQADEARPSSTSGDSSNMSRSMSLLATADAAGSADGPGASAAQMLARADDAREQLASFLHEERVVDELVASLTL
eukprot:4534652-Prymnesium_polylepis.1